MHMKKNLILKCSTLISAAIFTAHLAHAQQKPLQVSGIYPHLATFNENWEKQNWLKQGATKRGD